MLWDTLKHTIGSMTMHFKPYKKQKKWEKNISAWIYQMHKKNLKYCSKGKLFSLMDVMIVLDILSYGSRLKTWYLVNVLKKSFFVAYVLWLIKLVVPWNLMLINLSWYMILRVRGTRILVEVMWAWLLHFSKQCFVSHNYTAYFWTRIGWQRL